MLSLACSHLSHRKLARWEATCITHTHTQRHCRAEEQGGEGKKREKRENAEVTFGAKKEREERVRKR